MRENWQIKKLGDVTTLVKGKKPQLFSKSGVKPYLTAKVVRGTEVPDLVDEGCPVSVWVKPKDIVIIMDGSNSGEMFSGLDGALASTMGIIKFDENLIEARYLYSFLLTHRENFTKSRTGAAIPHLNKDGFEDLEIPLPSLIEQRRIVEILDEAFEKIAKAKENAEKNLQNSKELFESYLHSVFVNPNMDWKEVKLGDVAIVKSGGTPLRHNKLFWDEGNIPWYSSGELNDLYTKESNRFVTQVGVDNSNAKLFPKGSLLIGMYDTAALKMSILDKDATFNQAIAGVKPNDMLNLVFLLYSINAKKPELLKQRRGVRQKNLSLEKIKQISFFLPSAKEQLDIVVKLNSLSEQTKKLESNYKQKIADLDELKMSLLTKAFAGEL